MMSKPLKEKARQVLKKNLKAGTARLNGKSQEYFYICPSVRKYPHQWLWDSCFHAIVTSRIEPAWAIREMETLLGTVQRNGFLPSITMWKGKRWVEFLAGKLFFKGVSSRLTQPPVIAIAIEEVFKNTRDLHFVKKSLPALTRYYHWLETARDPDGDHLVSIIHPWESADDSPAFDKPLLGDSEARPNPLRVYLSFWKLLVDYSLMDWETEKILDSNLFNVENVMFNCIFAQGLRSLSRLSEAAGEPEGARVYSQKADLVEKAILERCWDPERSLFFDITHKGEGYEHNTAVTISSLFPIILDTLPGEILETLVKKHLTNPVEFWLPYPIPFVSKEETAFNPNDNILLWRGPVWINTNWFIWKGLLKHGYTEIAKELAKKTVSLVEKSGFREFYNPFTGKGEGEKDYGWSTLVVDMLGGV